MITSSFSIGLSIVGSLNLIGNSVRAFTDW
nr:MAG TPA: hypothetical protein [Caudoviricetes sp.]